MPEAVVEFIDGNTVHYEDARVGTASRMLTFYKDGEQIGFSPFEAIMTVSWKPKKEASGASFYEKQLARLPDIECASFYKEKLARLYETERRAKEGVEQTWQ